MVEKFEFQIKNFIENPINARIHYEDNDSGWYHMTGYHWHQHYEILMILRGCYRLVNHRRTVESDRPGIFIHRPYTLHQQNTLTDGYHRKLLWASQEIVNRFTLSAVDASRLHDANMIFAQPDDTEWQELNGYMDRIGQHRQDEITVALLTSLLIRRTMQIADDGRGEVVSCPFSYIQDALQLISDNLAEPYTIENLAARYSVGRSKFQADFKATTGLPYLKYLITLRLTRAREMLLAGRSIIDVSLEVGYASEAHFVKMFREYYGITPGEFIRKAKKLPC